MLSDQVQGTSNWSVFCDFDGTISIPDSCDFLLSRFADSRWKDWDGAVWRGELNERTAFPQQMALLNVSWEEARQALLAGVAIREGFAAFVSFCRTKQLPLAIVSSGLVELIEALLGNAGVNNIPIFAHRVEIIDNHWRVIPFSGARLKEHCSHCKCAHLEAAKAAGKKIIYIGDGYTDVCPAPMADVRFATGKLARHLQQSAIPYVEFATFFDIECELARLLNSEQDSRR